MKQEDKTREALGLSATASGTSVPPAGDERVIEAMHEYLAALEAGQKPDRAAFLDLAADPRAFGPTHGDPIACAIAAAARLLKGQGRVVR